MRLGLGLGSGLGLRLTSSQLDGRRSNLKVPLSPTWLGSGLGLGMRLGSGSGLGQGLGLEHHLLAVSEVRQLIVAVYHLVRGKG